MLFRRDGGESIALGFAAGKSPKVAFYRPTIATTEFDQCVVEAAREGHRHHRSVRACAKQNGFRGNGCLRSLQFVSVKFDRRAGGSYGGARSVFVVAVVDIVVAAKLVLAADRVIIVVVAVEAIIDAYC